MLSIKQLAFLGLFQLASGIKDTGSESPGQVTEKVSTEKVWKHRYEFESEDTDSSSDSGEEEDRDVVSVISTYEQKGKKTEVKTSINDIQKEGLNVRSLEVAFSDDEFIELIPMLFGPPKGKGERTEDQQKRVNLLYDAGDLSIKVKNVDPVSKDALRVRVNNFLTALSFWFKDSGIKTTYNIKDVDVDVKDKTATFTTTRKYENPPPVLKETKPYYHSGQHQDQDGQEGPHESAERKHIGSQPENDREAFQHLSAMIAA